MYLFDYEYLECCLEILLHVISMNTPNRPERIIHAHLTFGIAGLQIFLNNIFCFVFKSKLWVWVLIEVIFPSDLFLNLTFQFVFAFFKDWIDKLIQICLPSSRNITVFSVPGVFQYVHIQMISCFLLQIFHNFSWNALPTMSFSQVPDLALISSNVCYWVIKNQNWSFRVLVL